MGSGLWCGLAVESCVSGPLTPRERETGLDRESCGLHPPETETEGPPLAVGVIGRAILGCRDRRETGVDSAQSLLPLGDGRPSQV